jgi:methylated-DNA-protein-cysteine methyltransferase-like protein
VKFFDQVHLVVAQIPAGRVASYGQIARLLGQPHAARTVGWALRGVPEGCTVPWHRVVNAAGRISIPDRQGISVQQQLLESEGVVFSSDGRIDLNAFGWDGLTEDEMRALIADS